MERTPTGEDKTPVESPPLEEEEAKVEGGSGPRNELDPALAFALDSFKTAVGQVRDAPPAEDEVEGWGLALSKAEPELVQRIAYEVGVDPALIFGRSPDDLKKTVLAFEVAARPRVKTDGELTRELLQQQFLELRAVRQEANERATAQDEKIAGLQEALVRTQAVAEDAQKRAEAAEKKKSRLKDDVESEEEEDDKSYVYHFDSKEKRADGSIALNPHQFPARPPLSSDKPHLFHNLASSPLGKELKDHASDKAWLEYVLLKSVLSFLWDALQYHRDFGRIFGSSSENAFAANQSLLNTYQAIYDLLSTQLALIQFETHQKSKNPTWKLTEEDKERFAHLAAATRTFGEKWGNEGDVPAFLFNACNKYSKTTSEKRLTELSKKDAKKPVSTTKGRQSAPRPNLTKNAKTAKKDAAAGGGVS